ncbi:hypothetical protein BHE74_00033335 [Ensete ventricosum]|nr:hypothetical protein BHE74_00033335 [Ensete ventricosum]RZS10374.1 hypothetical protein BHM03_00041600 [Ensete ventricosum]
MKGVVTMVAVDVGQGRGRWIWRVVGGRRGLQLMSLPVEKSGWRQRLRRRARQQGWQWLGAAAVEEGWQRLCGSDKGCDGGCAWLRKDSDDRWEEAAGASTFGAAVAAREMGILWLTAAAGRKKGWATTSSNDGREGQRRSRGGGNDGGWATCDRGLETATMVEGVAAGCSLRSRDGEEEGGSGVRRGLPQGRRAAGAVVDAVGQRLAATTGCRGLEREDAVASA